MCFVDIYCQKSVFKPVDDSIEIRELCFFLRNCPVLHTSVSSAKLTIFPHIKLSRKIVEVFMKEQCP